MTRSPSTSTRVLLFFVAVAASWVLLMIGFPPGAPDRLPVLLIAVSLAFVAQRRPEQGLVLFGFLFPCAGLLVRLFGATDPSTWPALLFGGLAVGWTFRFIYDFDSRPVSSAIDPWLKALILVWTFSTVLAAGRAETLWAVLRGLTGRSVNGEGLLDAEAIRESLFSMSAFVAGAAFYFVLRHCDAAGRRRALQAAGWGITVSALVAVLQKVHVIGGETRGFWKLTGRLAGGSVDPNSLGLLCALAIVPALARGPSAKGRGALRLAALAVLITGLLLSGSRSGFLLVVLALAVVAIARGLPARVRLAGASALLAILLIVAALMVRATPGTLGARVAESLDPKLPLEYRVSQRPLLWAGAAKLFLRRPIEGEGLGSFSWRFPDLMLEEGRRFPTRDNPGSAYLQALAETGSLGFLLIAAFAAVLVRQAFARIRTLEADPVAGGAGVVVVGFLLASLFGSHWYAPDVSLFFFLLASIAAQERVGPRAAWTAAVPSAVVAAYGLAALLGLFATRRAAETFRYSREIGLHEREVGPAGPFRWTRKNFAYWLPAGTRDELVLTHVPPIAEGVELTATTDGRAVYRHFFFPGDSIRLQLNAGANGPRAIVFSLSRAFVPKRLQQGQDRRELGLRASLD